VAYSPGVAEPCVAIQQNERWAYEYTAKGHLVGVITNGTAVLGLGERHGCGCWRAAGPLLWFCWQAAGRQAAALQWPVLPALQPAAAPSQCGLAGST
jgi:hypothetical protein